MGLKNSRMPHQARNLLFSESIAEPHAILYPNTLVWAYKALIRIIDFLNPNFEKRPKHLLSIQHEQIC